MWAYRAPDESWRRIYEQFKGFCLVLHQKTHPKHTSTFYNRIQLIVLWNFPNEKQRRLSTRRIWHAFILIQINVFFLTLLFALPESVDHIVDLGQDILWMIGTFYMLFKWHFFFFYMDDIDEAINDLDACHCEPKSGPAVAIIRSEQLCQARSCHTMQFVIFNGTIPSQHPIAHVCIYIWQCFFLFCNMACILYTDLFSSHCFAQLAVNLKILCIELNTFAKVYHEDEQQYRTELGRLGYIVDRTNEVFYAPQIMQMLTAFLMISLSTFEALVSRHEPTVAARFVIFMVLSFCHQTYWCLFGDMVTEQSEQVAFSAYMAILKQCYSSVSNCC
ncbi:putative odorant receptor 65b [Drosophila montana]|uniref:putative odorant receptor 65b n=1 Tax=Drosophila montana TaxID=40370 RepID=UPI00313C3707